MSTDGQDLDGQEAALKGAGAEEIFQEKVSGIVTDRKALAKAIEALKKGDTLIVTRLDRLARSSRDLLNILHAIGEKGAMFKSLADAWADTSTSHGKLMVTVLGGLAEFERDLIRARTGEGRARAKAKGIHMGRKARLSPHQQMEALAMRNEGKSQPEVAKIFGVSHTTIQRVEERARKASTAN